MNRTRAIIFLGLAGLFLIFTESARAETAVYDATYTGPQEASGLRKSVAPNPFDLQTRAGDRPVPPGKLPPMVLNMDPISLRLPLDC